MSCAMALSCVKRVLAEAMVTASQQQQRSASQQDQSHVGPVPQQQQRHDLDAAVSVILPHIKTVTRNCGARGDVTIALQPPTRCSASNIYGTNFILSGLSIQPLANAGGPHSGPQDLTELRCVLLANHVTALVRGAGGEGQQQEEEGESVECGLGKCCKESPPIVSGIKLQQTGTESPLSGTETPLSGTETRLSGIETRVSGIETRVSGIETRVSGIETRVSGIETRLGGIRRPLNATETPLGGTETCETESDVHQTDEGAGNGKKYSSKLSERRVILPAKKCLKILITSNSENMETPTTSDSRCMVSSVMRVGPVVSSHDGKKIRDWDTDQLWRSVRAELRQAGSHRLGVGGAGGGDDDWYDNQAWSCVRLLMLSTAVSTPLSLHTTNAHNQNNTKDPAFQLYNYSRCAALLSRFDAMVQRGTVEPLPDVRRVPCELLTQQEEWELLWGSVYQWPHLVATLAHQLGDPSRPPIACHAVARFAHDLAHRWSVYYNRVHILPPVGDEKSTVPAHLRPVLYARVTLLLAVMNTMDAAFALMGVRPPTHM